MLKKISLILISVFCFHSLVNAQTLDMSQTKKLKAVIWSSINNKHTAEGSTQFNGSFDWHSDVHAHWALLSIARLTKDTDLEKKMLSILTIERLEREFQFLMSPEWIEFEKPYGRTWMLLLLWELNHREISKNQRFQKIRWDLTQDMLVWLQSAHFPEQTWDGSLIGTHDSWLMSLFLFDAAKSQNVKINAHIRQLIQSKMIPLAEKIESKEMEDNDFLYLPALKYLINPDHRYENAHLSIPTSPGYACHYPGAIQVSLWAQASQCARHDVKACESVKTASKSFFIQSVLWKKDFDCVAHWVPQFVWMTHWLSLGKP
jgi:hypothetical protein